MAMTDPPKALSCGVRLAELLAQIADDAPPADEAHQLTCPYCQTALRRLRAGWASVTELTNQPVTVPGGLTALIMTRVRALAVQAADFVLLGHPRGETRVSHAVIGRIAQRLAHAVPGVVFASARAQAHSPPQPYRIDLSIQLVVTFGPVLHRLSEAVRDTVQRQTPRLSGAQIDRIDITIDDLA